MTHICQYLGDHAMKKTVYFFTIIIIELFKMDMARMDLHHINAEVTEYK